MKAFVASLSVLCLLAGVNGLAQRSRARRPQPPPCAETARNQHELNDCAGEEYKKADAELNRVYKEVVTSLAERPEHREKLKQAQTIWLKYRDATCEVESSDNEGGSIYPMVYAYCLASVTRERTRRLQEMLAGP